MSVYADIQRIGIRVVAGIFGTALVAFAVLVFVRMSLHTTKAEAASVVYYPNFCLGGWKYPQHASGPAAATGSYDPSNFNPQNSAFLESSVASQIFCGYFSVRNAKNPPTKAVITFNWSFGYKDKGSTTTIPFDPNAESYTNIDGKDSPISPATGFTVSPTSTNATTSGNPNLIPVTDVSGTSGTSTGSSSTQNQSPTSPEPSSGSSSSYSTPSDQPTSPEENTSEHTSASPSDPVVPPSASDSPASQNTPPTTPPADPTPAPTAPAPELAPATSPAPASDAPQTFNFKQRIGEALTSLIAERVQAAETDTDVIIQSPLNADTFKDFLEVSYSLDGIRWTAIGRVNKDNWKNFSVEIPVTTWDEVKRLQIMVSVLPTIDEKPDIYLDSMSMRAEYKQTVAELAAQGLAAVSNAVDTLIGDGNNGEDVVEVIPDAPAPRPTTEIRTKKLLFPSVGQEISVMHDSYDGEGRVNGQVPSKKVNVSTSADGASMTVAGVCSEKYFVVLTYRNKDDYLRKPRSFIVNRAQECSGGTFSFDLGVLSPETRDGPQYLVVGEQGDEGTWHVTSDVFPITIEATTTVQIITQ